MYQRNPSILRRSPLRRSPLRRSPLRRSALRRSALRRSPLRRSPLRRSALRRRRSPMRRLFGGADNIPKAPAAVAVAAPAIAVAVAPVAVSPPAPAPEAPLPLGEYLALENVVGYDDHVTGMNGQEYYEDLRFRPGTVGYYYPEGCVSRDQISKIISRKKDRDHLLHSRSKQN